MQQQRTKFRKRSNRQHQAQPHNSNSNSNSYPPNPSQNTYSSNRFHSHSPSYAPPQNVHYEPHELMDGEGYLEILPEGYGFLRSQKQDYCSSKDDIYISKSQIQRLKLREGSRIKGKTCIASLHREKHKGLNQIDSIDDLSPEEYAQLPQFSSLEASYPKERIRLEHHNITSTRLIDLICPLGKGQRSLILAPPRTGKTILIQEIAKAIAQNYPKIEIILLLIGERPEEVTEMRNMVKGEVLASTFDDDGSRHIQVSNMAISKAKRLVERGKDVVILLDSITRLARAFNKEAPSTGKTLTGGLTAGALDIPKKIFGTARYIEGGGSLTIIGTALIDTGSKMDEVIFEEFKGTGNMEIRLSRELANRRLFPAIDVLASGTRKEELLLHPDEKERMWKLRNQIIDMPLVMGAEYVLDKIKKTQNNAELLLSL
jgi:transcription termination factor Rho